MTDTDSTTTPTPTPAQAVANRAALCIIDLGKGSGSWGGFPLEQGEATPLECAAALAGLQADLDAQLRRAVQRATDAGASWADVGQALGVSRQTAWNRYSREAEAARWARGGRA